MKIPSNLDFLIMEMTIKSINSNAEDDVGIGDVRDNSAQARIEEVSIPVISAPIE